MWDKPQQLRMISNALFGISFLLMLYGALHYTLHLPIFALRAVNVVGTPQHVDRAQISALIRNELRGNFFTVDMVATQQSFEKLPWVRTAQVRRQFPWQLEVTLEEHQPLARWNGTELVNTYGEVFQAHTDQALPDFIGQPGTAAEVAKMYTVFAEQLIPLQQKISQISLSPRRAWQLRLNNGLLLKLGREQSEQRLSRFVAVYPYSLAPLIQAVNYVDLRYRNGFAAYIPGEKNVTHHAVPS
ncbi:MAG: cell division protein FtsQ/DivIB [Gallionellaceae bacterium]|nr:cell division protein FtsQ/DivIB [Gallionellaceae bacterium]